MKSTCRYLFVCLFFCVCFSTDCGEGSREGRSWTPSQKESQLWKEEKLQVWHCCRFLRRNLIRKVSHLFLFFLLCYVCSNSATTTREPLKNGWENKMRVNQPFVSRQIWNSSWESWKIYLSALFLIKYKGTIYRLGYCGAAVELIKCSR